MERRQNNHNHYHYSTPDCCRDDKRMTTTTTTQTGTGLVRGIARKRVLARADRSGTNMLKTKHPGQPPPGRCNQDGSPRKMHQGWHNQEDTTRKMHQGCTP